jgi:hypothetical protein
MGVKEPGFEEKAELVERPFHPGFFFEAGVLVGGEKEPGFEEKTGI